MLLLTMASSHRTCDRSTWPTIGLSSLKASPYYLPLQKANDTIRTSGDTLNKFKPKRGKLINTFQQYFVLLLLQFTANIIWQIHPCCLGLPLNMLLGVNRKGETIRWVGGVAKTGVKRVGFAPSSSLLVPTSRSGEERRQTFQSCPPAAPAA